MVKLPRKIRLAEVGPRRFAAIFKKLVKLSEIWYTEFIKIMALATKKKQKIIGEFKIHEKDTGSTEVQVAILSEQIEQLAKHLKKNHKDNHSRLGLLKMVAERRALMNYLAKKDIKRYNSLVKRLGLKK